MKYILFICLGLVLLAGCDSFGGSPVNNQEWLIENAAQIDSMDVKLDRAIERYERDSEAIAHVYAYSLIYADSIRLQKEQINYLVLKVAELERRLSDTLYIKYAELTMLQ